MQRIISGIFLVIVALSKIEGLTLNYEKDGYLTSVESNHKMNPLDRVFVESFGYPSSPVKKLRQTWSWISIPESPEIPTAIKFTCMDIRFPKDIKCEESSLKLKDGDEEVVYCGDTKPFTYISKGEGLTAVFTVGPKGQGYLRCTATAEELDSNREVITTPKPSYLTIESEEIDSEEHGGEEGDKSTTCPCGWANKISSRIVNGSVTLPNEFPFMAALVDKYDLFQFCGATIVTTWHALTAAHCTIKRWKRRDPMALLIGQHDLNDGTRKGSQLIDVDYVVEHSGYAPDQHVYDISLLVLKRELVYSAKVGPACLPTHQYNLTKQYVKIIGWGLTKWQGQGSDLLMKVNVRVVDRKECGSVYPMVRKLKNKHICTYAQKKASCQGDSGGPVVWIDPETNRYTLVGVVSFGRVCADEWPSVHTDVAGFLDWIKTNIAETKPSAQICFNEE